jgi:hypothetical protein
MRQRGVRSQIYLPVVKWGVNDSDWKLVYLFALASYAVPFALDLSYRGFPLAIPIGPAGLAAAIVFFNWTRRGRRGRWLHHTLQSLVTPTRHRRRIPGDSYSRPVRSWIRQETV